MHEIKDLAKGVALGFGEKSENAKGDYNRGGGEYGANISKTVTIGFQGARYSHSGSTRLRFVCFQRNSGTQTRYFFNFCRSGGEAERRNGSKPSPVSGREEGNTTLSQGCSPPAGNKGDFPKQMQSAEQEMCSAKLKRLPSQCTSVLSDIPNFNTHQHGFQKKTLTMCFMDARWAPAQRINTWAEQLL